MCKISDELSDVKVGYKVLAYDKDTDKFYSTFTGQEIGVGLVPMPPVRCKRMTNYWNDEIDADLFGSTYVYIHKFAGKTSGFKDVLDAVDLRGRFYELNEECPRDYFLEWDSKYVIVKITFSGDVYKGSYSGSEVIAGSVIESLEIINKESLKIILSL